MRARTNSTIAYALLLFASAPALAQTTQPTYTLRTRVPITIVDVVVTDSHGHPVRDLKQSDFTLLEDNKPVTPGSFEEHRSDETTHAAPIPPKLPVNTFTNAPATPSRAAAVDILLIDSLNTPVQVQQIVQHQMLAFVDAMQPGMQLEVLSLSTSLAIVQGFTSDRELLKAAITNKKLTPQVSPVEDSGQEPSAMEVTPTAENECDRTALRAQYGLSAMSQLARYLGAIPGRKNLIWFSGSFPQILGISAPDDCYNLTDPLKTAADQLARAHVVLYPVDPRALDALAKGPEHPKRIDEHLTMEALAEQTGGKATYTSNDLAGAVADAIDQGANFYTLTYTPPNQTLDTRFRSISVKIDKPGLHLTYRNGYYAVDPEVDARGKRFQPIPPMQAALMHGALDATQIVFRVTAMPAPPASAPVGATASPWAAETPVSLPANNLPNPKLLHPPYRIVTLSCLIDIHNIDFAPGPDGNYRGDFEYGVRVYNANGDQIVNAASKEVRPILPPAVFESMLRSGANAHLDIAIPATGDFFLRVAVHDLATGRVGSLEIPTASLTPAAPGQ